MIYRRTFFMRCLAAAFAGRVLAEGPDPWPDKALIEPAQLAKWLKENDTSLHVICVAFPVLYRQRHIAGAVLGGPCSKPEGLADLHQVLSDLTHSDNVVLYCGCCPMPKCPNIRPAYEEARKLGFQDARVLNLGTNFHTDWVAKGYPVE